MDKAIPRATPETRPFWDGAAAGELRIQLCTACRRHFFYPRPCCPHCASADVRWVTASGRATLYSYVISHRPAPGFTAPYAIAVVELAEGVRMMTNIVGVEVTPDNLILDMPLRVRFERRGDMAIPVFAPDPATEPPPGTKPTPEPEPVPGTSSQTAPGPEDA